MKTKIGTLYGIGVGLGDPELITLKATKILSMVHVVFTAASTKNNHSLAVNIAKPHIPETTSIRMLSFPMTKDKKETQESWAKNARIIIKEFADRPPNYWTLIIAKQKKKMAPSEARHRIDRPHRRHAEAVAVYAESM